MSITQLWSLIWSPLTGMADTQSQIMSATSLAIFVLLFTCYYTVRTSALHNMYIARLNIFSYAKLADLTRRKKEKKMYKEIAERYVKHANWWRKTAIRNCRSTILCFVSVISGLIAFALTIVKPLVDWWWYFWIVAVFILLYTFLRHNIIFFTQKAEESVIKNKKIFIFKLVLLEYDPKGSKCPELSEDRKYSKRFKLGVLECDPEDPEWFPKLFLDYPYLKKFCNKIEV